jgi:hypothetical protein
MSVPAEKSKTKTHFDIEISALLESLRHKLALPSKWKRTTKKDGITFYQNGNYCLGVRMGSTTSKLQQLAVEVVSEEKDDVESFFSLSEAVISEVDSSLGSSERGSIFQELLGPFGDSPQSNYFHQKTVNGIIYRCSMAEHPRMVFSAQRSPD